MFSVKQKLDPVTYMCNGPETFNNFGRKPTKNHSCEVWSKANQWFRRRCRFKKLLTDGRTHDGRRTKYDHETKCCLMKCLPSMQNR